MILINAGSILSCLGIVILVPIAIWVIWLIVMAFINAYNSPEATHKISLAQRKSSSPSKEQVKNWRLIGIVVLLISVSVALINFPNISSDPTAANIYRVSAGVIIITALLLIWAFQKNPK